VYSALAGAFIRQKQYDEARFWAEKALAIYPENKFAARLLKRSIKGL
jgi:hypothetical protein